MLVVPTPRTNGLRAIGGDWMKAAPPTIRAPPTPDAPTGARAVPATLEVIAVAVAIEAVAAPGAVPRARVVAVAPMAVVTTPSSPVTITEPLTVNRFAVAVCGRFWAAFVTRMPGMVNLADNFSSYTAATEPTFLG
jgi:hypothetical protein